MKSSLKTRVALIMNYISLPSIPEQNLTLDSGKKHRGTLISFWIFFQGLLSLLERVMHIFFSKYQLFDGIGDAYFKGYA